MEQFITPQQIDEAAQAIKDRAPHEPQVALVLGSGLSSLADAVNNAVALPFHDIPHWPTSTVAGHSGRLVFGKLEGKSVLVMQGRVHYYEGYGMSQLTMPVRVMRQLGVRTLILTNAAGGLNPAFSAGDLMLIRDHINMLGLSGHNPLRGPNDDSVGPRFPDMTVPYDAELRQLAHEVAAAQGITLQEGVYAYVAGPSYETPAELRFLLTAGADAVGMSTVPSVVVARHGGMRVLGISTITNMATPDPKPGQQTTHEEVLEVGKIVVPKLTNLIHGILRRL